MSDTAIGIDIGATHTKLVWLSSAGEMLEEARIPSSSESARDLVSDVAAVVDAWRDGADRPPPAAAGVVVPGLVSIHEGLVLCAPNLPILDDFRVGEALAAELGCRVVLDNDAQAAGLAEARRGAAQGAAMAVCLTVGTGVGGSIVEGGRLWRGCGGLAGEVGRWMLERDSDRFFEQDVGAAAVVAAYRELGGGGDGDGELDAAAVGARAQEGDEAAIGALERCGGRLGVGIAALVNLLNPSCVVVGGGVASAGELFLAPARAAAQQRAWPQAWAQCEVVGARLGAGAGAIGAALLALEAEALQ